MNLSEYYYDFINYLKSEISDCNNHDLVYKSDDESFKEQVFLTLEYFEKEPYLTTLRLCEICGDKKFFTLFYNLMEKLKSSPYISLSVEEIVARYFSYMQTIFSHGERDKKTVDNTNAIAEIHRLFSGRPKDMKSLAIMLEYALYTVGDDKEAIKDLKVIYPNGEKYSFQDIGVFEEGYQEFKNDLEKLCLDEYHLPLLNFLKTLDICYVSTYSSYTSLKASEVYRAFVYQYLKINSLKESTLLEKIDEGALKFVSSYLF